LRVARTPGENIAIAILLHCNTAQKVFQEIKPYCWDCWEKLRSNTAITITITIVLHCNTAQKVFQEIKSYSAGELLKQS